MHNININNEFLYGQYSYMFRCTKMLYYKIELKLKICLYDR